MIAFNLAQANAISEELDRRRIEHPEIERHFGGDRLDNVFVKHLEAVQGDERDVIVFSVGYGFDEARRFTMNFGPLNKEGGYRRLNVAVTRARELVELVSSVRASDFSLGEKASRGTELLRDYVAYAEREGEVHEEPSERHSDGSGSDLEASVAETLNELGYQCVPRVGVGAMRVDIGVVDPHTPDRFLLGIECDGPAYRFVPTARDRDRLREEVLAQLGWRIHRVWAADWAGNRRKEVEQLKAALEAARSAPASTERRQASRDLVERTHHPREIVELKDASDAAQLPWVIPYTRVTLPDSRSGYEFHEPANRQAQVEILKRLLDGEAPVHVDYATRRLAEAWGLRRSGHRVATAARQAIQMTIRRGDAELRGAFIWLPGQSLSKVRVPVPGDPRTRREIEWIPPEEIDMAIRRLRDASLGAKDEALTLQTARVLGFDRVGSSIRSVVEARLRTLAKGG